MTCTTCGCLGSKAVGNAAEIATSPFFGSMIGRFANFFTSIISCQRNIKIIQGIVATGSAAVIAKFSGILEFFSDSSKSIESIPYKPFALSISDLPTSINIFENTIKLKATSENDFIISHPEGSEIFAIGGLNYLIAGNGHDKFYFSLCSADIIDGKVSVISNFNKLDDSISYFCTKTHLYYDNVTILHETFNNTDITYVHVIGQEKNSSIALIGNIDLNITDIILNEKWPN